MNSYKDKTNGRPGCRIGRSGICSCLVCSMLIFAFSVAVRGQASSSNYLLTAGQPIAGGGSAGSASYAMTGNVPLTGAGLSGSSNFVMAGGVIPAAFGTPAFAAFYDGALVETVTKTDQVLKVAYVAGPVQTTGVFYFRAGGSTAYQSDTTAAGTGDTLVYTVSADLLTARGLEYYFVITQGPATANIGSAANPYTFVVQLTNAQGRRPIALPALNYRTVGVPINIAGTNTVSAIFGDDLGTYDEKYWRLFSYNTATGTYVEYPAAASVIDGRGYWLIQRTPTLYGAAGFSQQPNRFEPGGDFFEVPLDSGWNLVSSPFAFDVSWAEVRLDTGDVVIGHSTAVIDDAAYWYNGATQQYAQASTIPAWDGFFVFVKRTGVKMLFRYREATKSSFKPLAAIPESWSHENWRVHLRLECDGLIDDGNFAGVKPDAEIGPDDYDLYDPPPAPGGPRLFFRLPDDESGLRRIDCRPPFSTGAEWAFDISPGTNRAIIVTGVNCIPDEMRAVIVLDNGAITQVMENIRIEVPESVVSGRLIIGTDRFFASQMQDLLPTEFALEQNFPNPFNPVTSICFALPEAAHVRLTVFNILGQRVKAIVDEDLEPGHFVKTWDSCDDNGRPVASGIYFYRLDAGKFIQCRKMVLLK